MFIVSVDHIHNIGQIRISTVASITSIRNHIITNIVDFKSTNNYMQFYTLKNTNHRECLVTATATKVCIWWDQPNITDMFTPKYDTRQAKANLRFIHLTYFCCTTKFIL